jgi:3',5'-cyclic AMP phosphodiesterase CpdA
MFTLAHRSDPHLGPLPQVRWRDLASKRAFGYANWRRGRSRTLGPASLQRLVADLHAEEPAHTAVTGDLINIGLPAEIETAHTWLAALGTPGDVSVVPGNHDAYLPGALRHYTQIWAPYMTGDDGTPGFPYVRIRDEVAIVGASSAVATAPLMATGRFGETQAAALVEQLEALRREGLFRVVLIHHPPVEGSTPWHKRLRGASRFRAAVAEAGAELILHGHNHVTSVGHIRGRDGPVPVVGATSASLHASPMHHGGSYLVYRIERGKDGFIVDMEERGPRYGSEGIVALSTRRLIG